jgi:hypothetical protein
VDTLVERRVLLLAVAADLLAEASLQNILNAVYHATVLVIFLAVAAAATRSEGQESAADEAGQEATTGSNHELSSRVDPGMAQNGGGEAGQHLRAGPA